ncbi:MAG: RNase P subunit p30 family protein, partial [Candidatus Methanofastidiosia archaeon]
MHKNYRAIDLRGYPCDMYEKVYQVYKFRKEKPDYEYLGVELSFNDLREIRRLKKTPIFVRGGTEEKNRRILENKRVSVLSSPYPVNHFQAKLASKNGTAFEINVSEIVRAHGYARAILMEKLQKTIRVARKYHSPILIT